MERRKKILSILLIATIAATLLTTTIFIRTTEATDPSSWYMTVNGVLATDYYSLYPFKTDKSLKIGFSKFGEMIDSSTNVGLEYRDRDAFAPAAGSSVPPEIAKHKWMSGWLINITYMSTSGIRNVWAMAQHADLVAYGNDWIRVHSGYGYSGALTEADEDPTDPGKLISTGTGPYNGGRKTNGTAITEDIRVLYNGPRMFVARTVTHIYDWDPSWTEDEPLVDVVFTFIFNKVKKEVIVIKDIKEVTTKFVFGQVTVPVGEQLNATVNGAIIQFSNRGEWDIGPANTYDSYVHFYVAGNSEALYTVYDEEYHLNPTLYPAAWFGLSSHGSEPTTPGTYDVAQIVAKDRAYVGWAAFWPSLSNWHVDAGYQNKWWKSLSRGEDAADTSIEPFMSPYIIGEWDFVLTKTPVNVTVDDTYVRHFDRQFRGVTVYGLTDNWTGDDAKRSGGSNVLDLEVLYQLDEVFNPWDLRTAVHKDTKRWVEFHTVTTAEYQNAQTNHVDLNITLTYTPVKYSNIWEDYCNFSERVEWGGARRIPVRAAWSTYDYELYVDEDGVGVINIPYSKVPAAGTIIKILYSTETEYTYNVTANPISLTCESEETPSSGIVEFSWDISKSWTDYLRASHEIEVSGEITLTEVTEITQNLTFTLTGSFNWFAYNFKVFKEDYTWLGIWNFALPPVEVTVDSSTLEFDLVDFDIEWTIDGPTREDLHVEFLDAVVSYNFTAVFNTATGNYTIYMTLDIEPYYEDGSLYYERIPGRYEWVVVGNHSRAIDSIGAAMVAAAFKNKQVEIGNGGLDMMDMWGTNVPYLLSDMGYATWRAGGPAWTDIYDSIGRLAYIDDWCTRYPVSTSNIITVAGPSANLFSEYFNEFSQAIQIYGITSGNLIDVIFAPTCWNTTKASNYLGQWYYSNSWWDRSITGYGIGVISTYKDINGTVGFLIHGWSGDDTYYTCKWFHEYGIYYMQRLNRGVTTLVLRIDYTEDPHYPTVTILEHLGTISEKIAIHDP
ncbi:MAG: hypothetical protein QXV21_02405 [Candidatus Bathyarchaeia archaeon]